MSDQSGTRIFTDYRVLKDGEILQPGDLAFGNLSDGTTGWGKIPEHLHGQAFCEGASGIGHPKLVVRKELTTA